MNRPVELAPRHKLGLTLSSPVLLAAGIAGYGDALAPGLSLSDLGGFVTAPVTRRPWRGQPPRLVQLPGAVLWQRGPWNPGVRRVIRDFAGTWQHSPVPVIVHLSGHSPDELASVAAQLEDLPGVAGLELDVAAHRSADPAKAAPDAAERVWAVREAADLPLLARLPVDGTDALVQAVLDAGSDGLVLGQPPPGATYQTASNELILGGVHGPTVAPLVIARLAQLIPWVGVPLVTCGGVHSLEDALAYLAMGATAIQLDTAVWVDPQLPGRIIAAVARR